MNRRRWLRFQDRVVSRVLLAVAPAWLVAALLLWNWEAAPALRWSVLGLISVFALAGALTVRQLVVNPLRALANMLEALREGDYSFRGRNTDAEDAMGEVMMEVNSLSRTLHHQRLEAVEAGMLLEKVIAEIDIAVLAFDGEGKLRLVNRAGGALLGRSGAELIGCTAGELGLAAVREQPMGTIVSHVFPSGSGRWEIRRRAFRAGGLPHELLVITDLSQALREEERQAWRRLVRVLGHELNSSLTPIKSTAGTLRWLVDREPLPEDWREDTRRGLTIIHERAEALGRFMGAYARLARLPPPTRRMVDFGPLVRRVASLHGACVHVEPGPEIALEVDGDQIEQVLINLIKNAVEAASTDGGVLVRWRGGTGELTVEIEDDGPGLAQTENLWVPFFSTKPGGTGIGLVLSREIVENHGGSISLLNRPGMRGCLARIRLPLG